MSSPLRSGKSSDRICPAISGGLDWVVLAKSGAKA
jgi:hypothetical protein